MNPAIVIPTFRRPNALKRLLDSIEVADTVGCPLILISIEGDCDPEIRVIAAEFCERHAEAQFRENKSRLGLREHILLLGDLTEEYDAVIVLEEDLYVTRDFYRFATMCADFYSDIEQVSGISLYSPKFNEHASLPFEPLRCSSDVYFCGVPASWGQIFLKRPWREFRRFICGSHVTSQSNIPEDVMMWPSSSWKKLFFLFNSFSGKFFVYPYDGFSTNFSEGGQHVLTVSNRLQGRLNYGRFTNLSLMTPDQSPIFYDVFFEPFGPLIDELSGVCGVEYNFYGIKRRFRGDSRFVASTARSEAWVWRRSLNLFPHEANLYLQEAAHPSDPHVSLTQRDQTPFGRSPKLISFFIDNNAITLRDLRALNALKAAGFARRASRKVFGAS